MGIENYLTLPTLFKIHRQKWKCCQKTGSKYDAHHIIENSYGGNNEWWNIHSARFPK